MAVAVAVLAMLMGVMLSERLARRLRLPVPLVQIALGAAIHYTGVASVTLDPQVFFLVLLPPLLFLDGWRMPRDELLGDAGAIVTLALGLVVFTVLGVGTFIAAWLPVLPPAMAYALAAVLSPTDPIAVSAIASRTPMPRRMRRILEGESLFNDASGLVCMRFAVAAALTGQFSLAGAALEFAWVAAGGLVIGAVVTALLTRWQAWAAPPTPEGGGAQILGTLLLPAGVYLLAEALSVSGILAAVAAGIAMGYTPHAHWLAATRIRRTAVWDTVQFVANGVVFVLLGEQIPALLAAAPGTAILAGHAQPWWLLGDMLLILVALFGLRFVWVWVSLRIMQRRSGRGDGALSPTNLRLVTAMSVAGVRGAITLAGVLTLPLALAAGEPFAGRDLAITLAAGVIVLSLVLATLVLPQALKGLVLADDSPRQAAEHQARAAAAEAAVAAVQQVAAALPPQAEHRALYEEAAERLAHRYRHRFAPYGDDADDAGGASPPQRAGIERQLRLAGLRAERRALLQSARSLGLSDSGLRKLVREVDLQEARDTP